MVYSEARHVNNYCILNKIYGKEKMRIDRAIAAEKEVVYLD